VWTDNVKGTAIKRWEKQIDACKCKKELAWRRKSLFDDASDMATEEEPVAV
jgi:hypothetical protein